MTKNNHKTSILFVVGAFGTGGKERQLSELIYNLPKENYSLHLLVKNQNANYLNKIKDQLSSFHSLDRPHFKITDIFRMGSVITEIRPDVVCSWAEVPSYFILLGQFFIPHRFKFINCSIRSAPIKLSPRLRLTAFFLSFFRHVVANSKAGLKSFGQNGRKGRHVLYNGFDQKRIPSHSQKKARELAGLQPDVFVVVMVASLTEKKDHETFLKAIVEIKKVRRDIVYYIVGDGYRRSTLESQAEKMGLNDCLYFLGKRDDVEVLFKAADLSVLISTSWFGEGISNSIIESMSCGTPVIATESPGTLEVITDGLNGLIISCEDYHALSERILSLSCHPEIMKSISENAIATVKEKFSIEQLVKTFISIVENK